MCHTHQESHKNESGRCPAPSASPRNRKPLPPSPQFARCDSFPHIFRPLSHDLINSLVQKRSFYFPFFEMTVIFVVEKRASSDYAS